MNIHYGKSYDYFFSCSKCGIQIETSVRVAKDLDAFFYIVDRIHPRRCSSARSDAERGKHVEYGPVDKATEQRSVDGSSGNPES